MMDPYHIIAQYGDHSQMDVFVEPEKIVDYTENNFEYVRYNPRKDINRWGLSVTSLAGGLSGIPDLDSLLEYNKENGTAYGERDFRTFTDVYNNSPEIQEIIEPWKDHIFRTHFLKFGPGGFFPPHRDPNYHTFVSDSFRLIMPLKNVNPPYFNFVLEDKLLHWQPGRMYYLNTNKMHYLFNSSIHDSYWLVLNVDLNEHTIRETLKRFLQK